MILTLNIDTDDATDLEALKALMAVLCPEAGRPKTATCSSIMETARRRSAGEQVIYKAEPKKRDRKPKNYKEA